VIRPDGIQNVDCLQGLARLDSKSVDFVFADLPYGRTQNDWDKLVPIGNLWAALRRVCKPDAALVFTAIQPFTSLLVCSNLPWFRYEAIWRKSKPSGYLNAKKQPMRVHENVLVFYGQQPAYTPQMTHGHEPVHGFTKRVSNDSANYGATNRAVRGGGETQRYPVSVLEIPSIGNSSPIRVHPTQKPEALPAWFIATYTKPGDLVLDPTAGSGSTGCAALRASRRFVGFETDAEMARLANAELTKVVAL
jgi:DNA modification methylase